MVKSSIFKICPTKYKVYNNIHIYNLGYVEILSEKCNKQSQLILLCVYLIQLL